MLDAALASCLGASLLFCLRKMRIIDVMVDVVPTVVEVEPDAA